MDLGWNRLKQSFKNSMGLWLVGVFILWMSAAIPLSLDDYAWKSAVGMERLKVWFHDYNGRYLSNILEMILTRYYILQVFVMTFFSTLLIVMMKRLTFKDANGLAYIFILLLVLMLPMIVFAETFGWVAGYVNYVTSAGLMLYLMSVVFEQYQETKLQLLNQVIYFIVGFVSTLFVEHVTLYLVLLMFCANVYYVVKRRKLKLTYINLFIAVCLGAVVMLSNHAYRKISHGNDPYRTMEKQHRLLDHVLHVYFHNITQYFFVANWFIIILLLIVVGYITYIKKGENLKFNLSFCLLLGSSLFFVVTNQTNLMRVILNPTIQAIAGLLFLCNIIMLILFIWKNFQDEGLRLRLLFYDLSAMVLTVPFFVVTPYSTRCTFASHILFLLILLEMIGYCLAHLQFKLTPYMTKVIGATVLLTLTLSYLVPLSINQYVDMTRSYQVMHQKNYPKVLKMKKVPYPEFHTQINFPENAWMEPAYRELHHIPKTTHIKFE